MVDGSTTIEFTVGIVQELGLVSVVLLKLDGKNELGTFLFDDLTSTVTSSLERDLDLLIDRSTKIEFTVGTVQELGLVSAVLLKV